MIEYGGKQLNLFVAFVCCQLDLLQTWRTLASLLCLQVYFERWFQLNL